MDPFVLTMLLMMSAGALLGFIFGVTIKCKDISKKNVTVTLKVQRAGGKPFKLEHGFTPEEQEGIARAFLNDYYYRYYWPD